VESGRQFYGTHSVKNIILWYDFYRGNRRLEYCAEVHLFQ